MVESVNHISDVNFRSECPVCRTLDLVGDKWTLLIMRDALFLGGKTFADFAGGNEKIPTNLLSDRLKKLVSAGLLRKHQYHDKPPRYEYLPTPLADELKPLLEAMRAFGENHLEGRIPDELLSLG